MANSASSKKRIKQNDRNRTRNRARKSGLKSETRLLTDAIHDGNIELATTALSTVQKTLDQISAKGTLHKNTVARRKSRLAKQLHTASVKK